MACSEGRAPTAIVPSANVPAATSAATAAPPETPQAATMPAPAAPLAMETPGAGDRAQFAGRSRRSRFVPLDDPAFVPVDQAGYFNDDELVLGAEWAGEVRAYPVRMLRYHHIVNDTVAENPLLVTY